MVQPEKESGVVDVNLFFLLGVFKGNIGYSLLDKMDSLTQFKDELFAYEDNIDHILIIKQKYLIVFFVFYSQER